MGRLKKRLIYTPIGSFLLFSLYGLILPVKKLQLFFPDDAYFYIKTAMNIRLGMGSTFDGLNATNGYHPLYLIWLCLAAWVKNLSAPGGLYLVWILDSLLFVGFLYLLGRFLKKCGLSAFSRWLVMMLCAILLGMYDFGNESRLLLPLAWGLAVFTQSSLEHSAQRPFLFSSLACLVFLARLDAILWVGFLGLLWWRCWRRQGVKGAELVRRTASLCIPLGVVMAGYFVYNQLLYGNPATVSSMQKFGWPGVFATRWLFTASPSLQARFLFAGCTAWAYLIWQARHQNDQSACSSFAILNSLSVYALLYLTVLVFWGRGEIRFWYFVLPVSVALVIWGLWLDHLGRRIRPLTRWSLRLILSLAVLFFFIATVHKKVTWTGRSDAYEMAQWMRHHTPPAARFFQVDGCGVTGYFSDRTVINGDGLINSFEYQRILLRGELLNYLVEKKVDYLIWNRYQQGSPIAIPIPLKDCRGYLLTFVRPPEILVSFGSLILVRADQENIKLVAIRS